MEIEGGCYEVIEADDLPMISMLAVPCPMCGARLEYEPCQDDAGGWIAMEDWPVCDACQVMVVPKNVSLRDHGEPFFAGLA